MNAVLSSSGRASRIRGRVCLVAIVATAAVVLAACGSSNGSNSQATTGGSNSQSTSGSNAVGANVAEAEAFVTKYQAPLTTFNLPPLTSAPPTGKKIAVVLDNTTNSNTVLSGVQGAAAALGWTTVPIVYDPTKATGLQDAFAQAVTENPDGVMTSTVNTTQYAQAAGEFAAKNIPVVTTTTDEAVAPPVIADIVGPDQIAAAARIVANYVVAQKGSDANVAMFNIPSLSILVVYEDAFKAEYLRLCPTCKFTSVAIQLGDIGTKVPAQVVSTIQTDPTINFVIPAVGPVSTGVPAALSTAGISDVKIVGLFPALDNIEALITGSEDMWVGSPIAGLGWQGLDALARHFSGESAAIDSTAPYPFQILTKANASQPAAQPEVENTEAYFKNLWQVG